MISRKSTTFGTISIAIGLTTIMGCRDVPAAQAVRGTASAPVSYAKDIAPILFENCVACHRPGGSAPFSLLDFDDVRRRARQVVEVTANRVMPPWLPEAGHGQFADERRLTKDQIDTIRWWGEQGMPEGNLASLPPRPRFAEGWQLGEPDLVVTLPQAYTLPAGDTDVWRNFVIPLPLSETQYVKTAELRPGSSRFVHHALMGIDDTRASRRRDERDGEIGFGGMEMGDARMPAGHLVGWTPGMVPFPGIEGAAWGVDPGTDLVLQLHMLPSGLPQEVKPMVGLYFADTPGTGTPMYLLRLDADEALDIPAGAKDFVVTDTLRLPVDADLLAVYPHAHYLGAAVEGWASLPDGTERSLIRIDGWDFKWQDVYRYARPVSLPAGTTVGMRWRYDNSADNPGNPSRPPRRVVAGNRSSDEMAHLQLQLRLRHDGDLAILQEAHYRHAIDKQPGNVWNHYSLGNALWDQKRLTEAAAQYRLALAIAPGHVATRNNLGAVLVEQGALEEATDEFRLALGYEPEFVDAHYNLGNTLRARGRVDEAIGHYREALRLEPGFGEAHNNLGQVLGSQGELEEALSHFQEAVRLNPDSAEAHNNLGAVLGLQGHLEEAVGHFRRALAVDPNHAGARQNMNLALGEPSPPARQP